VAAGLALLAVAVWGLLDHQPRLPSAGAAPAWVHQARATRAPAVTWLPASPGGKAAVSGSPSVPPAPSASAMPAVLPIGAQSIQIAA